MIQRLVARSPLPLNILLGAGRGPNPRQLASSGCGALTSAARSGRSRTPATRRATQELLAGRDEALRTAIPTQR